MASPKSPVIDVSIISDIVCPWCYVGVRRLDKAVESIQEAADDPSERPIVRIRWLPFMLNPNLPMEGVNRAEYYRSKFGPDAVIKRMTDHLVQAGKEDGIHFSFSERMPNTILGHRLLAHVEHKYPDDLDKQDRLSKIIFRKYFEEGLDVGSPKILADAASEAGVSVPENFFQSDEELQFVVDHDTYSKTELNVSGVPYFMFSVPGKDTKLTTSLYSFSRSRPIDFFRSSHPLRNSRFTVSGAQPPATFIRILGKLLGKVR